MEKRIRNKVQEFANDHEIDPVVVDICMILADSLDEILHEYEGSVKVGKGN